MRGEYQPRVVDAELAWLLSELPAVEIRGARGIGKTETASRFAKTVHRVDDPATRQLLEAQIGRLVAGDRPILVDEWQHLPAAWDVVRRAVDDDPQPGSFLLTGSAAPSDRPVHPGAGRIVTVKMRPMGLSERDLCAQSVSFADLLSGRMDEIGGESQVGLEQYVDEILASGFPGIRTLPSVSARAAALRGYVDQIVEHDFREVGHVVRRPARLRRWLEAYASATGTTSSYNAIRRAASGRDDPPPKSTTGPWRGVLERLFLLDPVAAWSPSANSVSRLTGQEKHHLVDPALAAALLGVDAGALLSGEQPDRFVPRDGVLLGGFFESLVAQSVRVLAQSADATVGHLRTARSDQEVDLIVERRDRRVLAIEVKLSEVVGDRDVRHLIWLRDRLGADLLDAVVITTGRHAYRRPDGVAVVPAALLGP